MSAQVGEGEKEAIELPLHGDLAFGALMDALVPDSAKAGAAPGEADQGSRPADGAAPGAAAPAGGDPHPPADKAGPAGGVPAGGGSTAPAGQPGDPAAGGDQVTPAGGTEQPAAGSVGSDIPADWTASADQFLPQLGELSTKLEENFTNAYQQQAYDTAREEYEKYFEALEVHPRMLVGQEVPRIGAEGSEILRDTSDAKEWQEAVRSLLVEEITTQAEEKMEESADFLQTVHASIDLFKNNRDLIPGTKDFDRRLADQFAGMMKPYEVRVEGKLQGYSIPVQPIIDSLRAQAKAAAPPPPSAAGAAPEARPRAEPPQAGIASKAGASGEREDFSTLFGTIGLPNLQI